MSNYHGKYVPDDYRPPDVRFTYGVSGWSAGVVDLQWRRPAFLTVDDPGTYLEEQKNSIYEWLFETYGEDNYAVRENQPHFWTIYLLNDPKNTKVTLFKLQWGDSHNWPNT